MNKFNNIESIDTSLISDWDLNKIYEIEKDMWAREEWIWEYIICKNCQKISSKEDIFWHLSNEIFLLTVSKIEETLWIDGVTCKNCNSTQTDFLFWNEYIDEIRKRYQESESYLTVYRDKKKEIRWFVDWYIDNFTTIYQREFEYYYSIFGENNLKKIIEEKIWGELPEKIFCCTALWTESKYKNIITILNLIKSFYNSIDKEHNGILWIAESRFQWLIHILYLLFWTIPAWVWEWVNHNKSIKSDIFITPETVNAHKTFLSRPTREIIKKLRKKINSFNI